MRRWVLVDGDGQVVTDDLQLTPSEARTMLDDLDGVHPGRAPHTVALAGGES